MRLLLDEMHAALAAEVLRDRGIDAIAVTERPDLRGQSDLAILRSASEDGRAVVTESAGDFLPIVQRWSLDQAEHGGLVLTHPRRFGRALRSYPSTMVDALVALDHAGWPPGPSAVHWL